jgi:hypothetical protein
VGRGGGVQTLRSRQGGGEDGGASRWTEGLGVSVADSDSRIVEQPGDEERASYCNANII